MADAYNKADLRSILRSCNIEIVSETGTDFLCLCPFHHNTDSPAFAVSYSKGLYICYNQNCDSSGTILDLVKQLTDFSQADFDFNPVCLRKKHWEIIKLDLIEFVYSF